MQEIDLRDLKKRIADQIELTQEMTWDGQSTTEAKETLPHLPDAPRSGTTNR